MTVASASELRSFSPIVLRDFVSQLNLTEKDEPHVVLFLAPLKVGVNCPPVIDCVLNCVPIEMRDGCPACYCYGGHEYKTDTGETAVVRNSSS